MDRRSRGDVLTTGVPDRPDELAELVRSVAPHVLASLLRGGEEFAAAEDALQDAVLEALRVWPKHPLASLARG